MKKTIVEPKIKNEECCQVKSYVEEGIEKQVQFNLECHLDEWDLASDEVIEALADPEYPARELTHSGLIEALIVPDDLLGLRDKESFDMDADFDTDLDHTTMGQTLSKNSNVNSLADYLVEGGHLDDKENATEKDFLRMPVHCVTVLPPEFELFHEIIYEVDNEEDAEGFDEGRQYL